MNDHINDNLIDDVAIAHAVRNFLTSPAIVQLVKACATAAANEEARRLMSDDRILEVVTDALDRPSHSCSQRQRSLRDSISDRIESKVNNATEYLINEDQCRDFIKEELSSDMNSLDDIVKKHVEQAIEEAIDIEDISRDVRDHIRDDLKGDAEEIVGDVIDEKIDDAINSLRIERH